ncbi:unnamed protein product [Dibothriocephalus latus]|uniref:Uncharacterized protein n=1 Tax=Dibothriocephalus latus TaxID=60516 RepID=A0A3P7NKT2_DIBLA|nr:unnamed protein product [Dibothriocephalus latus]
MCTGGGEGSPEFALQRHLFLVIILGLRRIQQQFTNEISLKSHNCNPKNLDPGLREFILWQVDFLTIAGKDREGSK